MQLDEKVVLLPGASRPVGRAIARKLAEEGATLILPYFDWPESSEDMIREFTDKKYFFSAYPADLTDEKQVKGLFSAIQEKYGALHHLVNNIERGGMPIVHGPYKLPHNENQWDIEINTTLKAKWLLFQHALPLLKENKQASVVNISSISGGIGRSGPAELLFNDGYSAANRAISSFTETWAREGAPEVRVNEIMLGLIRNRHGEGTRGWQSLSTEEKQRIYDHILLNRTGFPEEVAALVFFLLCRASYMTGSVVRMDGGYLLGGEPTTRLPEGILS